MSLTRYFIRYGRLRSRTLIRALGMTLLVLLAPFAHSAAPNQTTSGITLHNTRVIFPGSAQGGVSYTLTNNTSALYLLEARIGEYPLSTTEVDTETTPDESAPLEALPIVVLPPLQRFEAGEQVTLRLRTVSDTAITLPQDRESVWQLRLKAIPSQTQDDSATSTDNDKSTDNQAGVTLRLAVQNNLKVFYRPEALPVMTAQQVSEQLQVRREGDQLVITNPTGYYVTFSQLSVGKTALSAEALHIMTPPFGTQAYPLPSNVSGEVSWQTLNDYGSTTEVQHRP